LKTKVVEIQDMEKLSPIFKGKTGHQFAKFIIHLFAIDKVNAVYERSCNHTGADFADSLLNDLGVKYQIGNAERLQELPEGAFITVSNHPYGGIDGIMLIDLMAGIRPDYKLMVNKLLSLIRTMDENFISVKPRGNRKEFDASNINGIRETVTRLQEGHPVGFFPSGAVSDFSIKELCVRDREWQQSIIKLIQMAKAPIVPIRFFDMNSPLFYFLGLINWRVRVIRMPYEIFNKQKQRPRIGIGKIITVEEQAKFKDNRSLGAFLRKTVYDMPRPTSFIPGSELKVKNS
jgi:putative hemolysin